ncbi:MAG TPA: hypothetical protein VGX72_00965 [Solirubrobacteraceae bacterium]|jgi:hypothetical protein|nr:hypothetical protein [Solirubrobacteraceae bacterium]
MRSTRLAALTPLLALAALVASAMPANAEPVPRWLSNGKEIGPETVTVKTSGTLTFDLTQFGVDVTCKVTDVEKISNPASGGPGLDEMTTFKLTGCKETGPAPLCATAMEVTAHNLPWHSHLALEPPAPGVRDAIEGIELSFKCKKGKSFGTFRGSLSPKVGNSVLEFEGGKGLSGEFGTVTVTGKDKLKGPKGDAVITAA